MGLTGHILEVEFALRSIPTPWIMAESQRIADLDHFLVALKDASSRLPFVFGWIDCLSRGKAMGRGLLDAGRWATPEETGGRPVPWKRPLTFPFMLPSWVIGRPTVQLA